jgi:hypothetical protein
MWMIRIVFLSGAKAGGSSQPLNKRSTAWWLNHDVFRGLVGLRPAHPTPRRRHALKPGIDIDQARDIAFTITNVESYLRVHRRLRMDNQTNGRNEPPPSSSLAFLTHDARP